MQIYVQNMITSCYSEQLHDSFINNKKAQIDLRVRAALSEACLLTNINMKEDV